MQKFLPKIGLIVALCVQVPVWSQDGKLAVYVSHSGEDSVGKQFAYSIREAIRGSKGYQLSSHEKSSLQVQVVTIAPDKSSENIWTVAAISYTMTNYLPYEKGNPQTWYPIYLTSQVMTIGSNRTDSQARSVMAAIDDQVQEFKKDASK